ncbi:hypothetical protein FGO68_gene10960 [Halteria grandinella]|uniref:Aquaporin n=1 Tax=Halteria grandinella TaxID=5974 RepID=A0A8J8NS96_HALGN|nr:hypothetical protein FGO68_gene10960 [Halteria grandinella]
MQFGYKTGPDIVSAGLFMAILLTYRVSGSHLNWGVTFGVAIVEKAFSDKDKLKAFFAYLLGQTAGSYLGVVIIELLNDESVHMVPQDIGYSLFYVLLIEFTFCWIFLTIYLHAKSDWVAPSQDFGLRAFTMMIVCYACTAMSQNISGGPLNPNIALASMTVHAITHSGEQNNLIFLISYITAPILSGVLAGAFLRHFAIKVTPATPAHSSPFLGQKMRKAVNDSTMSPMGSMRKELTPEEQSALRQTSRFTELEQR